MAFKQLIRTRYSETGQDGIIHHSSYVVYLEVARLEFLSKMGADINTLEKKKIFCPVVDLQVHYHKPLFSLQDIFVNVKIGSFSKVRFQLAYEIYADDSCTSTASTTHCFVNEAFKPIAIPSDTLEAFRRLTAI